MGHKSKWTRKQGADGLMFGERLSDLISVSGKTATQIAAETGVSQSALSEYQNDNGARLPDSGTFKTLSNYFGVTYEYMYGDVAASKYENRATSGELGLSDKSIDHFRMMNMDNPESPEGTQLSKGVLQLFNSLVDNGFFDLLLDIELFQNELNRLSKDNASDTTVQVMAAVGNLHKDRPPGMALITQKDNFNFRMLQFERAFGELIQKAIAASGD